MHKFLMIILLLNCELCYSSCNKLLRIILKSKKTNNESMHSLLKDRSFDFKNQRLFEDLSRPTSVTSVLNGTPYNIVKTNINKFLSSEKIHSDIKEVLKIAQMTIFDKNIISEWAKNIYIDMIIELHFPENIKYLEHYKKTSEISDLIGLKVLLERSKDGGFSGDQESIEYVATFIEVNQFSELLKEGKLIVDEVFVETNHGHLTHLLQIDLIISSLKREKFDSKKFINFYKWMGVLDPYDFNGGSSLSPLKGIWSGLLDSFAEDTTSPDFLGPAFLRYFNWAFMISNGV